MDRERYKKQCEMILFNAHRPDVFVELLEQIKEVLLPHSHKKQVNKTILDIIKSEVTDERFRFCNMNNEHGYYKFVIHYVDDNYTDRMGRGFEREKEYKHWWLSFRESRPSVQKLIDTITEKCSTWRFQEQNEVIPTLEELMDCYDEYMKLKEKHSCFKTMQSALDLRLYV